MLEKRNEGMGIFRIGDTYKECMSMDIQIGGSVILKGQCIIINAEITEKISEKEFKGIIKSFNPPGELFEDLSIGDEIVFYEENIKSYEYPRKTN